MLNNAMSSEFISVLSLVVAILAVFVGPLISLTISKKHIEASLQSTKYQTLGPMRQAWINNLRDIIADLTGSCLHYWESGTYNDLHNKDFAKITRTRHKLELMLNPKEEKHNHLIAAVRIMTETAGASSSNEDKPFFKSYYSVMELSKSILKEEWNVIKKA